MTDKQPPVSVFRRVATPRVSLSPAERGGSFLLAASLIAIALLSIVVLWSFWVGVLRNQPPEPVEVWYDPYELGELPTD